MKLFYASGITYPSLPASRIQALNTAKALSAHLGDDFLFGACAVDTQNELYRGPIKNFGRHNSLVLGWLQLQFVRSNGFNAVYCREPALAWSIIVYNKLFFRLKLRFVFEAHDVHEDPRFGLVLKHSSHVFCVSGGIVRGLQERFPYVEASVLRNGVNLDVVVSSDTNKLRSQFGLLKDLFIVTYIGSIGTFNWKGEDVILEAEKHTKDNTIHYVIAGVKDSELETLREKYESEQVTILGRLNEIQVAELQSLSDVLVLPNKEEDTMSIQYTSPIKMFEYMRSGTPIIASDLPSIREVLNDSTAFFVKPNSPKALSDMVGFVLSNSKEAQQKAQRARQEVKQYTWGKRAEAIIMYLNEGI